MSVAEWVEGKGVEIPRGCDDASVSQITGWEDTRFEREKVVADNEVPRLERCYDPEKATNSKTRKLTFYEPRRDKPQATGPP